MKKALFVLISCAAAMNLSSQTVTTYAGSQYVGSGKYNVIANNPMLNDFYSIPYGICTDTAGNIWLTDQHNVIILNSGISRQRGGSTLDPTQPGSIGRYRATGTQSLFNSPRGVFVHPKTNAIYICDTDNGQIRSSVGSAYVNSSNPTIWDGLSTINPDDDNAFAGKYSFLGDYKDGLKSQAFFSSPEDIVVTADGTVYVSDYGNDCIRKISGNNVTTLAGKGQSYGFADGIGGNARFYAPAGICLDGTSHILVADRNNAKIRRVNLSTGQVTTVIGSGLVSPSDVLSVDGLIFIADDFCIKVWDGSSLRVYAGKPGVSDYKDGNDSSARFGELGLMVFRNKDQSIYVCDRENNVVRRIPVIQNAVPNFTCNNVMPTVGQTVKLTNTSLFFTSVQWNISPSTYTIQAGGKLTDTVIYVSFNATGSYNVTLTANNPSGNVPLTRNNYINVSTNSSAKPAAGFVASKTLLAINENTQLIDMSANTPNKWDWTITPRNFSYVSGTDSNSQYPVVKFAASGSYTVKLVATNANGFGSLTRTNYIVVASNDNQFITNNPGVRVYPNPTRGILYLTGVSHNQVVNVISADGRIVQKTMKGSMLDVTDLPDGMYVVNVLGRGLTCRFVKLN
ncbi:MAG: T9SS type A sorting domain-containing protein [Sphingomonadales bacterium]|jgi:PKD repeat protein